MKIINRLLERIEIWIKSLIPDYTEQLNKIQEELDELTIEVYGMPSVNYKYFDGKFKNLHKAIKEIPRQSVIREVFKI